MARKRRETIIVGPTGRKRVHHAGGGVTKGGLGSRTGADQAARIRGEERRYKAGETKYLVGEQAKRAQVGREHETAMAEASRKGQRELAEIGGRERRDIALIGRGIRPGAAAPAAGAEPAKPAALSALERRQRLGGQQEQFEKMVIKRGGIRGRQDTGARMMPVSSFAFHAPVADVERLAQQHQITDLPMDARFDDANQRALRIKISAMSLAAQNQAVGASFQRDADRARGEVQAGQVAGRTPADALMARTDPAYAASLAMSEGLAAYGGGALAPAMGGAANAALAERQRQYEADTALAGRYGGGQGPGYALGGVDDRIASTWDQLSRGYALQPEQWSQVADIARRPLGTAAAASPAAPQVAPQTAPPGPIAQPTAYTPANLFQESGGQYGVPEGRARGAFIGGTREGLETDMRARQAGQPPTVGPIQTPEMTAQTNAQLLGRNVNVTDMGATPQWTPGPQPGQGDQRIKGPGFLGTLQRPDGMVSTELSIGVNFDGQEREIPSLVPTLTEEERQWMLAGNKPTGSIVDKAVAHARQRMATQLSPFAQAPSAPPAAAPQVAQQQVAAPQAQLTEQQIDETFRRRFPITAGAAAIELPKPGVGEAGGQFPPTYAEETQRIGAEARAKAVGTAAEVEGLVLKGAKREESIAAAGPQVSQIQGILGPEGETVVDPANTGSVENAASALQGALAKMTPEERAGVTAVYSAPDNPTIKALDESIAKVEGWLGEILPRVSPFQPRDRWKKQLTDLQKIRALLIGG